MERALLFDLDETLMVEEPVAVAAFAATARFAASRYEIDPELLASRVRSRARELWYAAPTHGYCMRVGVSSWEGLWCRFEGDAPDVRALREWSPTYRSESWVLALADQGVDDALLAAELAERYGEERRARHEVFADVAHALAGFAGSHRLAVVTNGAGCLQREKLAASGLGDFFQSVVVSADLGIAKPDASVFQHAVGQLGVDSADAVMIGDSIAKDVDGALAAGLGAVWVNRNGSSVPADREDVVEISTLNDLPEALGE
jgi:putative hydrolase of the HAD superfamily